jgi:hypothetical protein
MVAKKKLSAMTDELVEQAILTLDEDAIVFEEGENGLEIVDKHHELWSRVYEILNHNLNEGKECKQS